MSEALVQRQYLVSSQEGGIRHEDQRYYAFPSILRRRDGSVLIAYKNGEKHYMDVSASLETIVIEPQTGSIHSRLTVDEQTGWIHQNPELIRMADDSILIYDDIQQGTDRKRRLGIRAYRSWDEGMTFSDEGWFPQIGDFQYGYAFDDVMLPDGESVMLVMSFPELTGGVRAVHAVSTSDSGRSWQYIRNLSGEFSCAFNESSLLASDDGYVIITRGDDRVTRAFRTDRQFRLQAQSNLTEQYGDIDYIGRPELLKVHGEHYILCRNIDQRTLSTSLRLYRFDAQCLHIAGHVELDSNDSSHGDSYYAEHYMTQMDDTDYLQIITYAPRNKDDKPSVVRLTYDWNRIQGILNA